MYTLVKKFQVTIRLVTDDGIASKQFYVVKFRASCCGVQSQGVYLASVMEYIHTYAT